MTENIKNIWEYLKPFFTHGNFENVSNIEFNILDDFESKLQKSDEKKCAQKTESSYAGKIQSQIVLINNNSNSRTNRREYSDEVLLQSAFDFGNYDEDLQNLENAITYIKKMDKVLDEAKKKRYKTYKDKQMRYAKFE